MSRAMTKENMPKDDIELEENASQESNTKSASETEHLLEEHKNVDVEPETAMQNEQDALRAEIVESKDRFLRLAADFENYKKISQREQQNSLKFANESLIINLLPVMDNLEQAIVAAKKSSAGSSDVVIGVEMVLKQMTEVIKKSGVEVFSAIGLPFDPARHEAMGEQIDDNAEDGSVIFEYQKGYLLHGRLVRPARVIVARRPGK